MAIEKWIPTINHHAITVLNPELTLPITKDAILLTINTPTPKISEINAHHVIQKTWRNLWHQTSDFMQNATHIIARVHDKADAQQLKKALPRIEKLNKDLILLLTGSPYLIQEFPQTTTLITYSKSKQSIQIAWDIILGEKEALGRAPF